MTCIVGAVANGTVVIGGDSMGSNGHSKETRLDEKVFRHGPFIIGFTTSFRMGQALRFKLNVPEQPTDMSDYEYMVTLFIDAVRQCLRDAGYAKKSNEQEEGGTFLVGYKGQLYSIEGDYQVGIVAGSYQAVGSGADFAKGAMHVQPDTIPTDERIRAALAAASAHCVSVGPPFVIITS